MVLVTGCAGFIGAKVTEVLLGMGRDVFGIDDMNDYYDVKLKEWRLQRLRCKNFKFKRCNITKYNDLEAIFKRHKFSLVYHLAARAGVGASLEDPQIYFKVNLLGTLNLLELCRKYNVTKFILSSSSSVYGNATGPFLEEMAPGLPLSPYAASKRSAEILSSNYHYLYGINIIVLRYFTVYGPAGRPDMSPFRFIKLISEDKPITVYGNGSQKRDFTYIDDIADGTVKSENLDGYKVINLGNNRPYRLIDLIREIEKAIGKRAKINFEPFKRSDMKVTWADISKAKKLLGWTPLTKLPEGIAKTVQWFKENERWLRKIKI